MGSTRLETSGVPSVEIVTEVVGGVVDGGIVGDGFRAILSARRKMLDGLTEGDLLERPEEFKKEVMKLVKLGVACCADMSRELRLLDFIAKAERWGKEEPLEKGKGFVAPKWAEAAVKASSSNRSEAG